MSRDHYKGIPKTRDAIVTSDGKIKPLDLKNIGTASASATLFDRRHDAGADATTQVLYIRTTGNDNNDGLTVETALRTLQEATNRLEDAPRGKTRQVFDVTDLVDTVTEVTIQTPPGNYNTTYFSRPNFNDDGRIDIFNGPFEIRADPTLVQELTVTNEVAGVVANARILTVSETLTPSAHVNQWVESGSGSYKWAMIVENTTNTVTVISDQTGFAASSQVYTQSCILSSETWAFLNIHCGGDVQITGVKLINTYGSFDRTSFKYSGLGALNLWFCDIDGMTATGGDPFVGRLTMHCSHIYTRFWPERHDHTISVTVFTGCNFSFHGSGGNGFNALANCVLDGCDAYGGFNLENAVDIEVNDCWVRNSAGHGIHIRSPFHGLVRDCHIEDSTGDAIRIDCGGGYKHLQGNTGGGNGGYGLLLKHGAQAYNTGGGNTVSGTSGQVKVGDNSVSLWSDGETTDLGASNPQMCRIFTTY